MAKYLLTLLFVTVTGVSAFACPYCNKQIRDGIYDSTFYPNLFIMLSAFIVLGIVVAILTAITAKRHRTRVAANPNLTLLSPVPLTTASIVTGIGLGGFFDGIVFHQILQVHEMLSNKIAVNNYIGKSINMFWDGIFHAFCYLVVIIGVFLLWKLLTRKDADCSGKLFSGGLIIGWGLFNVVEGLIDHQILKLHNVVELSANHAIANYVFLGSGVVMIIIGYIVVNQETKEIKR